MTMPKVNAQKNVVIELTCNETRLLLKSADINKQGADMCEEVMAAVKHYHKCRECKEISLSAIIGLALLCQEVLEMVVSDKDGRLLQCSPMTLKELVAQEHLWGRPLAEETEKIPMGSWGRGDYYFFKHSCEEVCKKFREHVLAFVYPSPRTLFLDLYTFRSYHILYLIPLFVEQGWSVEALFDLHRQSLLNYCGEDEYAMEELSSHIAFLQSALLEQIKKGRFNCKKAFERAEKAYEYHMNRVRYASK